MNLSPFTGFQDYSLLTFDLPELIDNDPMGNFATGIEALAKLLLKVDSFITNMVLISDINDRAEQLKTTIKTFKSLVNQCNANFGTLNYAEQFKIYGLLRETFEEVKAALGFYKDLVDFRKSKDEDSESDYKNLLQRFDASLLLVNSKADDFNKQLAGYLSKHPKLDMQELTAKVFGTEEKELDKNTEFETFVADKQTTKKSLTTKKIDYLAAQKKQILEFNSPSMPHDVLLEILSFLDKTALFRMSQVNRFWSNLTQDPKLWKKYINQLLTENPQLDKNENEYKYFKKFIPLLKRLQSLVKKGSSATPGEIFGLLFDIAKKKLEILFIKVIDYFKDFDVNYKANYTDERLVHVAHDNIVILKKLIARNANPAIRRDEPEFMFGLFFGSKEKGGGKNALDLAINAGAFECVEALVAVYSTHVHDFGLGLDDWGLNKKTALQYAAEKGSLECIKLLVNKGAKLVNWDITPYEVAVKHNQIECAKYLAEEMQKRNIKIPILLTERISETIKSLKKVGRS